jgi:hypothetical protein
VADTRRVAEQDTFAVDQHGVRRRVREGAPVPVGWTVEGEDHPEPPPKPSKKRAPKPEPKPEPATEAPKS